MNHNIKLIQSSNSEEEYGILIDQQIGKGTFGKVYKAINMNNATEKLAAKVLPINDNKSRNIIEREFDIIKELPEHPNLIKFKPFKCFSQNNFYILMEYCKGNLFQEQNKSPSKRLSENKVIDLFYQLISGYKVLHDAKILHQDIKPQNILIKGDFYKLADFGLSIFYQNKEIQNKREGAIGYIAPEKLFNKHYKGHPKSDIYSMGIVMYDVITGKHPYLVPQSWKHNDGIAGIIEQIRQAKVKIPYNVLGQYSLGFNQLFDKVLMMIEKSDSKRISFKDLEQFVQTSPLFNNCKLMPRKSSFEQSKHMKHSDWIIKQVSQVLMVPFDLSDDEQQKIIKKHHESKSLKQKTQTQKSVEKLRNYILQRRLVVYFLDRIARRLIVRKMKQVCTQIQSKTILHLILFSKRLTTEVMSEIQAPKKFTFLEWKFFGNSQNKQLIDLVIKDNRHLEGTIYDTFVEDKYISKNDLKSANLLYRGGDREQQIRYLQTIIMNTVKQIASLVDSQNSSSFVTILLLLKACDIVNNKQLKQNQVHEIQNYNRFLEDKTLQQLIKMTLEQCQKKEIFVTLDYSDQIF